MFFLNDILIYFLSQTILLSIIWIIFEPVKLIRLFYNNS